MQRENAYKQVVIANVAIVSLFMQVLPPFTILAS